ncbi:hypothetical protein GCM10009753_55140 [Streptantibioticus ferralitis]|uniref:Uncharacterized protein n=1 Tax=Streptantibioticus ferralitis TaxID=236510 RepID=A0ABT5YW81_9ACTN|nr:hypothetical protein [Streptantibioticus ferralitis]MDF2255846.1 hypothetical protein [Streptantibioticus ferralitis]
MQAIEIGFCVNAAQVIDMRGEQGVNIGEGAADADAPHACCVGGMHAGRCVLDDYALCWCRAEQLSRGQVALGVGLATLDVIGCPQVHWMRQLGCGESPLGNGASA